jgi:hypothetical protein
MASVALIGSFRKHLAQIRETRKFFIARGIEVTTPLGNEVMDTDAEFIRFYEEFNAEDNHTIQTITMHRILRADATYVVNVGGYLGNTGCYEIGRIVHAGRPLYFSERPLDLPLSVPNEFIVTRERMAALLLEGRLTTLHAEGDDRCAELERALLASDLVRE